MRSSCATLRSSAATRSTSSARAQVTRIRPGGQDRPWPPSSRADSAWPESSRTGDRRARTRRVSSRWRDDPLRPASRPPIPGSRGNACPTCPESNPDEVLAPHRFRWTSPRNRIRRACAHAWPRAMIRSRQACTLLALPSRTRASGVAPPKPGSGSAPRVFRSSPRRASAEATRERHVPCHPCGRPSAKSCRTFGMNELPYGSPHSGPGRALGSERPASLHDSDVSVSAIPGAVHPRESRGSGCPLSPARAPDRPP